MCCREKAVHALVGTTVQTCPASARPKSAKAGMPTSAPSPQRFMLWNFCRLLFLAKHCRWANPRGRGGLASACGLGNNEVTNHWVRWDGPTVPFWIPVPEASQGFACHPELLARCWLLLLVWKDTCFAQSGAASARSCFPESCAMLL